MIDYQPFLNVLDHYSDQHQGLAMWRQALPEQIEKGLDEARYGDLPRWRFAYLQAGAPQPRLRRRHVGLVREGRSER